MAKKILIVNPTSENKRDVYRLSQHGNNIGVSMRNGSRVRSLGGEGEIKM